MKNDILEKFIGYQTISTVDVMKKIDKNAICLLYIVDDNNRLVGCLTDGDIRRWIIKTGNLTGTASQMMNPSPRFLYEKDAEKCQDLMNREKIYSVPIVDASKRIIDIKVKNGWKPFDIGDHNSSLSDTPIIIMAGGKGTRLYPYTKVLPKPLIPIREVPILERIFDRFYHFGVKKFYLTVNYKKEMIKSYFSDINPPYAIQYIEEENPAGTAGSICLIREKFTKPVLIANCDSLIEADYGKIVRHHRESGNDMTIISSVKNAVIPYGVLHSKEDGIVTRMEEKPQFSYIINTGMYIVNPEFLDWIPENRVFHMTDLADIMLQEGKKVGMYPVSENSFLDMGEFEEMKKMEERIQGSHTE